jgi:hypothetical protein|tara:strand:+ start:79 stop:684 length:606 start_codon:yes stop_codon:yes gene_type:complete
MATTATPYGLKAVNHIGGTPYAGSTRLLPIASGYATNIYNGSVVAIVAAGTVEIVTDLGNNADAFPAGVIGVFVGCTYTDPNAGTVVFRQNWPTGTVADDAQAYIIDDPDVVFMAQADGAVTQADLGQNTNFAAVQSTTTGDTTNGNSSSAVSSTTAATSTIAFRIVDFVDSPTSTVGDAFTDLLLKFNAGIHSYTNSTGI